MPKKSSFREYFARLRKYLFKHRQLPSFETMMELLDVRSKSVVHRFMQQLIEQGFVHKHDGQYQPDSKLFALPAFESIRAGFPAIATDEHRYDVNIYEYLVPNPEGVILVKVVGDSMQDAGILEGDMVVVDKNKRAVTGDIVIAEIDGDYTMKYLEKEKKGNLFLKPGNPRYFDLFPKQSLNVVGVVIGSFRTYLG